MMRKAALLSAVHAAAVLGMLSESGTAPRSVKRSKHKRTKSIMRNDYRWGKQFVLKGIRP